MNRASVSLASFGGVVVILVTSLFAEGELSARDFQFEKNDRIAVLGGTFAERAALFGEVEARMQIAFPAAQLSLRNMGWSGDEVGLMPRPLNFGSIEDHLRKNKINVVFLCYGANESFRGKDGLEKFVSDYEALVERILPITSKLVFLSPIAHEKLGPQWPDPKSRNQMLGTYTEAIRNMADELEKPFVDLFHPTRTLMAENFQSPLTINGIHLTDKGYQVVADILVAEMGWGKPQKAPIDEMRSLIVEKNRQFFQRWRPVNSEYIFGRRNQPFGVISYPPEMKQLDQQIIDLDGKIHQSVKKFHDSTVSNR